MPAVTVRSRPNGLPIGDHGLADLHRVGIRKLQRNERLRGKVDVQERDVGGRIDAHEGRLHVLSIREPDLDLLGALDDVVVRDDVAVLVDHEAGAESARGGRFEATTKRPCSRSERRGDLDDSGRGALVDLVHRQTAGRDGWRGRRRGPLDEGRRLATEAGGPGDTERRAGPEEGCDDQRGDRRQPADGWARSHPTVVPLGR